MGEVADQPLARLSVMTDSDGGLCVRLVGELDISSVSDVRPDLDGLLTREPQPVLLDLGELRFMDSSGVAVLIRIANHFGQVRIGTASTAVRRVVQVLGLAGRLGLDGTD